MSLNILWKRIQRQSLTFKARTGARPKRGRPRSGLLLEPLEHRTLLSNIVWLDEAHNGFDTDHFDAYYHADAEAARKVVHAAISAWEEVIDNFNYVLDPEQPDNPRYNTFEVSITATAIPPVPNPHVLGYTLGFQPSEASQKPVSASIQLDDDAAGGEWFFDTSPY